MAQLLRCGAAVDAADEEGCTPLHHALLGLEARCVATRDLATSLSAHGAAAAERAFEALSTHVAPR